MDRSVGGQVVTARLASGVPVRVMLTESELGDGMTSVGLRDLDLDRALDAVGEIGTAVITRLKEARPTKATVELRLGFAVEAGKLTALWVGGRSEAAMTVTLEWSHGQDRVGDGRADGRDEAGPSRDG
jgi:hypothetical protein